MITYAQAQNINQIEKQLTNSFQKINYWSSEGRDQKFSYDSLKAASAKFEKQLLKFTSSQPETLKYNFSELNKIGVVIATSADGKFRIYSWDTGTGGTMRFFKNVYQYESQKKVYSKIYQESDKNDAGVYYHQINDLISGNKKYYLTLSKAILSSGLTYHNAKIFSIENNQLNTNVQLIKTKTGIRNQLGYEVDLTAAANRNQEITGYEIEYDAKNKIISIPLIQENSKVTNKKIRYQFKGKYFEKL